ncbi:MAG: NYN domain-containing protein [Candidatus Fermentithermobacillus carboniphilus]|uniref:NYN domain-containing protein n=1 Tax=Candidatus Fermentithermobacillus carboniphilus TaxID=3085328 RepID=A0AAT9LGU1_9FIRM|nr:MAG: NYN domain-containing protein [Candidatus Fermentithermobacillus carboniphilus]
MGNVAILLDSGYLNNVLKKYYGETRLDYREFADWVCDKGSLFQVYYYDCLPYQSANPTPEEAQMISKKQKFLQSLRKIDRFTVRLGRLEYRGHTDDGKPIFQQKRIDLQIGLDVASLVFNQRIDTIAIVSGDSDLIPAIELAKNNGIIIRLVHGPKPTYHQDL